MRKFLWSLHQGEDQKYNLPTHLCSRGLPTGNETRETFLLYFYEPTDPWSNSTWDEWCASSDSFLIFRLELAWPFSIVPDIIVRYFDLWTAAHCPRSCTVLGDSFRTSEMASRSRHCAEEIGPPKLVHTDFYYCRVIYRCHFLSNKTPIVLEWRWAVGLFIMIAVLRLRERILPDARLLYRHRQWWARAPVGPLPSEI